MDRQIDKRFEQAYFDTYCDGKPYYKTLSAHLFGFNWLVFYLCLAFNKPKEDMVNWLRGKSLLDAGCAFGHVVHDFSEAGVLACGYDCAEYAITNSLPSVQEDVWLGDSVDVLPNFRENSFDIVFSNSFQYARSDEELALFLSESQRISRYFTFIITATPDSEDHGRPLANDTPYSVWISRAEWEKKLKDAGFQEVIFVDLLPFAAFNQIPEV